MLLGLHQLTSPFARPALLRPLGFITPAAFIQVSTLLAWAPCMIADAETTRRHGTPWYRRAAAKVVKDGFGPQKQLAIPTSVVSNLVATTLC